MVVSHDGQLDWVRVSDVGAFAGSIAPAVQRAHIGSIVPTDHRPPNATPVGSAIACPVQPAVPRPVTTAIESAIAPSVQPANAGAILPAHDAAPVTAPVGSAVASADQPAVPRPVTPADASSNGHVRARYLLRGGDPHVCRVRDRIFLELHEPALPVQLHAL